MDTTLKRLLIVLATILSLCVSGIALGNTHKTVAARVTMADGSFPVADDITIEATDAWGETVTSNDEAVIYQYDNNRGIILILLEEFAVPWEPGDTLTIFIMSGNEGSPDYEEGSTSTILTAENPQTFINDPNLDFSVGNAPCVDTDSDGLCNDVETNTGFYNGPDDTGTDPNNADSDGDGLNDGEEVVFASDPNKYDTDRDGYFDLIEYLNGTDPNVQNDPGGTGYDPSTDSRVFNLNIDGNGSVDALTDGLVIRYLFGSRGEPLINGVVDPGGIRTTALEVEEFIANGVSSEALDIDGNGSVDALTDGLVIIRYLFGSRGEPLINGVVDPGGSRTTSLEIEAYIQQLF